MKTKLLWSILLSFPLLALAQLEVKKVNKNYTVTFDGTFTGVNQGVFAGNGWDDNPGTGQMDSDGWSYTGMSDGDLAFGGKELSGDAAHGISNGGVSAGGYYAFNTANGGGSADRCLGFQANNQDMTPGTITLRMENGTGDTISVVRFAYEMKFLNNENRATLMSVAYSENDTDYTNIPSLDATSTKILEASPQWVTVNRNVVIDSLSWLPGDYMYFQWTVDDEVNSSGLRDEIGIDDVQIIAFESDFVWDGAVWSPDTPSGNLFGDNAIIFPGSPAPIGTSTGLKSLRMRPGAELDIDDAAGPLAVVDTAFFEADGSGYSQIDGCILGTTVYQTYLTGDSAALWYDIAFPVDATLGDISGVKVNANGIDTITNIWYYDATQDTNSDGDGEWMPAAALTDAADRIGYQIYLGDGTNFGTAPFTVSTVGSMLCGNQSIAVSASTTNDYNLIPNPYASQLDWEEVTADADNNELTSTYYIQDGTSDDGDYKFRTYNSVTDIGVNGGSQYLAPGQSFFVQLASAQDETVVMKDDHRSITSAVGLYRTTASVKFLKLQASHSDDNFAQADETVIAFDPAATDQFEIKIDAKKLSNRGFPNLASLVGKDEMVYNILNDQFATKTVPLSFDSQTDGQYFLSISNQSIPQAWTVTLEDLETGAQTDLKAGIHAFQHSHGNVANRFLLHINQSSVGLESQMLQDAFAFVEDDQLKVMLGEQRDVLLNVTDASGRTVAMQAADESAVFDMSNWASGVYIINAVSDRQTLFSTKIINP